MQATVSWEPVTNVPITTYVIGYSVDGGSEQLISVAGTSTSRVIQFEGQQISARVQALGANGAAGVWSAIVQKTVTVPAAPMNVSIS